MYFRGNLVRDKQLDEVAARRRKKEIQKSIPNSERDSYLADGWQVKSESKYRTAIAKQKECIIYLQTRLRRGIITEKLNCYLK